jgi:hypothetical protein
VEAGNTNQKERFSTVELLIKVAFCKKVNKPAISKVADLNH